MLHINFLLPIKIKKQKFLNTLFSDSTSSYHVYTNEYDNNGYYYRVNYYFHLIHILKINFNSKD